MCRTRVQARKAACTNLSYYYDLTTTGMCQLELPDWSFEAPPTGVTVLLLLPSYYNQAIRSVSFTAISRLLQAYYRHTSVPPWPSPPFSAVPPFTAVFPREASVLLSNDMEKPAAGLPDSKTYPLVQAFGGGWFEGRRSSTGGRLLAA